MLNIDILEIIKEILNSADSAAHSKFI